MDFTTRVMLCIGTVCAGLSAALLFAPPASNPSFTSWAILSSASFAYFAFAFGTVRWATVSVASYVATMGAIVYFVSHRSDPLGVLALVAAVAANAAAAWARLRNNRHSQPT